MRFDQYYNESRFLLDNLKESLAGREDLMMTVFIQQGPDAVRARFGLTDDADWKLVFDRLVFSKEVVKKCVVNFMPFFKHLVAEKGPLSLRTVFEIEKPEYDKVFEQVFDLVAVSDGAIYDYVFKNAGPLAEKVKSGKGMSLRKDLGMGSAKYDPLWSELLDIIHTEVCAGIANEDTLDRGLDAFSLLMSSLREQRSLRSYAKMWEYSEKVE